MRLLAAHDRSEHELRTALAARGVPARSIDAAVRRLRDLGYLDDRRFATLAAERAVRRGYGSERVRAELLAKGVAEGLTDAALAASYADERALAQDVLARRFGAEPVAAPARAKAARFLLGRGFPEHLVLAILGEGC